MSNEEKDKDKADSDQPLGTIPTHVFLSYQSKVDSLVTQMMLELRGAQYDIVKVNKRNEELEAIIERMKLERLK